jgi:imidazole glycerol-phosphate synthase subunit HisH
MTTVAVLDYGMGNLRSVCKAIEHVAPKARVQLVTESDAVRAADRVVFPGQGAIGSCVRALQQAGLRDAVLDAIRTKPFLGICLGLQALYDHSDEDGGTPGFGVLRGQVRRFMPPAGSHLKVPHMGWNQVRQARPHALWRGIEDDTRFYFVHSFYAESADPSSVAGATDYGQRFTSAAAHENVFAVQFHPEKSQQAGLQLLANFVTWDGNT